MTTFASPQPTLHVAAHEAVHKLQHAGVTRDYGLGSEGHANAIADELEDGRPAGQMLDDSYGAKVSTAIRPYTEDDESSVPDLIGSSAVAGRALGSDAVRLRDHSGTINDDIAAAKVAYADERKHYAIAVRRYELETAQYRLSQSQGVNRAALEQQHAALKAFHQALEIWHIDLVYQKSEIRAAEERVRAFEGGGPDWGNISGRNRNRAEGWVKLWGGVWMTVGSLGLNTAVGGDLVQAGGRQLITGEDASTAVRAGVSWASEKQGYSPRDAKTHGRTVADHRPAKESLTSRTSRLPKSPSDAARETLKDDIDTLIPQRDVEYKKWRMMRKSGGEYSSQEILEQYRKYQSVNLRITNMDDNLLRVLSDRVKRSKQ